MNFTVDSYVCIRDASNNWFMANGFPGEGVTSTTLYSTSITGESSDKLWAPAGTVTFTLTSNGDGTFTLSEGGSTPVDPVDTKYIEFTNTNNWSDVYIYVYGGGELSGAWPGTIMENKGDNGYGHDNWGYNVPTNAEFIIFSNGAGDDSGGQQTVNIPFSSAVDGWYLDGTTDSSNHYNVKYWPDDDPVDPPVNQTKTVLFTNNRNWSNVYCYAWDDNETKYLGDWPGSKMTSVGDNGYGSTNFSAVRAFPLRLPPSGIYRYSRNQPVREMCHFFQKLRTESE